MLITAEKIRHPLVSRWCGLGCKNQAGNVSVFFGLAAVPLFAAMGFAVDYGSSSRARSQLQAALDAATLAAVADSASHEDPAAQTGQRLEADLARLGLAAKTTVSSDASGKVTVVAEMEKPTLFLNLIGEKTVKIRAMSSAVSGAGGPMDLAIAFDTTGSMAGAKLANAQQAASDLVDLVFKLPNSSTPNPNVRVGLVPFDFHVNVGTQYRGAAWMSVPPDYTDSGNACWPVYARLAVPAHVTASCDGTQDCSYDDYNDYAHQTGTYCYTHTWEGCVGSQSDPTDSLIPASAANTVPGLLDTWCSAPLQRLTNDPAALKASIASFTAQNETYIAPGLLWGWRVLSDDPAGPFHDGGPKAATNKRLILMTDGANTHSASYPDHNGTDTAAANTKLLQVCDKVKADGIQVYTIAFEVTDSTIIDVLTQCSSGPPFFYNAHTIADLTGAFHNIGAELTRPRLTN